MKNIKEELIGQEMTCGYFDHEMQLYNYYSEYEAYDQELLDSGCIIYISTLDNESQARIEFDVTIKNSEDEDIRASYIKIKDIDL